MQGVYYSEPKYAKNPANNRPPRAVCPNKLFSSYNDAENRQPFLTNNRNLRMAVHSGGQGGLLPPPQKFQKYLLFYRGYPQKVLQKGFCPPLKMFCVRP